MTFKPLEVVHPTTACTFSSPVEKKLAILYQNQEKIYTLLKLLVQLEERRLGVPIEIK